MKKIILLLLAALLTLGLCACGGDVPEGDADMQITGKPKSETEDASEPAVTDETGESTEPVVTDETGESTEPTEPKENTPVDLEKLALAESCIDKDISELYKLIGEPDSADYTPSCLVDGEDGMLYYEGFIVYTTRENGVETVYYVEQE